MKASQKCIDLIKRSESLSLTAYLCQAGKPTIGWGHTRGVKLGQRITLKQAEAFLRADISSVEVDLNFYLHAVLLTQGQFDALCDFTFNLGIGDFLRSTLYKLVLNHPNESTTVKQFNRWIYGGDGSYNHKDDDGDGLIDEPGEKKQLGGLVTRRKEETKMYLS